MRVLFFAHLKDVTGCDEADLKLAAPVDVDSLWRQLLRAWPELGRHRDSIRLARNLEYASATAVFADTDELALIPPVSGG